MIDRAPNMDAARAAAADLDAELARVDEVARAANAPPSPAAASSAPRRIAAAESFAKNRASLLALATVIVGNASIAAAKRWGAHWIYTEQESAMVANAALDVAELYIDDFDNPWLNLALALAATALPRLVGEKLPPLVEAQPTPGPTSSIVTQGTAAA